MQKQVNDCWGSSARACGSNHTPFSQHDTRNQEALYTHTITHVLTLFHCWVVRLLVLVQGRESSLQSIVNWECPTPQLSSSWPTTWAFLRLLEGRNKLSWHCTSRQKGERFLCYDKRFLRNFDSNSLFSSMLQPLDVCTSPFEVPIRAG